MVQKGSTVSMPDETIGTRQKQVIFAVQNYFPTICRLMNDVFLHGAKTAGNL
jgi:hypothetical protein